MTDALTRDQWAAVLDEADDPATYGEVLTVLEDKDLVDDAHELLDTALDNDILHEKPRGSFPTLTVNDASTTRDTADDTAASTSSSTHESARTEASPASGTWEDADFGTPTPGVWPQELLERDQWMGHVDKKPFAPWANRDHPEADADADARWKWGLEENYVDGPTVAMAEDDPRLDGRAFLQQPDDPYVYVDGDDVRDPETKEVHPAFKAILEHLGLTYADISTSGAGVHAMYRGDLPDGVKQAAWQLDDEPWGSNDDLPSIEVYPGKRVCVATGDHVPGTPTDVHEWNDDVLDALLEANDQYSSSARDVSTEREDYDIDDHDPDATTSTETTDDIRDLFYAIDQLDAQRVADRTIVHAWNDAASTSEGERAFVPVWGTGSNGTANIVNSQRWQDTGDRGGYGGPVAMAAIDAPDINVDERVQGGVTGQDWFDAVDHLRDLGFDIPELEASSSTQASEPTHTPVLPSDDRFESATSGWDWRHTSDTSEDDLSIQSARDRTTEAIADAYERGDRVLIEALPTMGKSYGAIKAAAETGAPISLFTGRGRKEQYEQFREWCEEHDLKYKTLPAFTRDCDTANGEHGQDWADTVRDWYHRGATPSMIHKSADYALGRPLPCQEHEGQQCPYASKWDFDPDDYDVLIGHYSHAHKSKVTAGRVCVFDEFPSAYETQLGSQLQGAISYWLQQTDEVPFDDYTDLIEHRNSDQERRGDALLYFEDHDLDRDEASVFDDSAAHAVAPLAVYTLLASDDLGNGFEHTTLDAGTGVFNRQTGAISLLQPPALEYARGVVGLDGTPTMEMWELVLDERLNHREVLQPEERAEYVQNALNLNLIQTTDAVKSYSPKESEIDSRVTLDEDTALLEAITDQHDERPSLITTNRAEELYDQQGVLDLVEDVKHYGNVLGSNEFGEKRVGAVIGARNYGPQFVQKWCAYAGKDVDPTYPSPENDFEPTDYGAFGNKIRTHMREHETLQAAMRYGRDGNGAVVYVHTNTLPDWVPLAGEGRVIQTWSHGMQGVLEALNDLEAATTADIAAHPSVDVGRRQVLDHLETLRDRGVLTRAQDDTDGRRVRWTDNGLHRVSDHGDVDLDPVDVDDLTDEEVAELARTTTYTWKFRNPTLETSTTATSAAGSQCGGTDSRSNRGDRTPHDAN